MNKKFLSVILFSALMFGATGMFTSCKDYDDDIEQLNNDVAALKTSVADLQTKVGNGKFVTNIVKNGDGITVTWNDGSTSTITTIKGDKGDNGKDGVDGKTPTITIDPTTNNWVINGTDTGICAAGKDGAQGPAGVDAKSPSISEETGNWVVYTWNSETKEYEAKDTGISAKGAGAYITDKGSYYELNVAVDKEGSAYTQVKLPKAATIMSLQAAVITSAGVIQSAAIELNYGLKLAAAMTFNGKSYAKNQILLTQTSTLSTIVNPMDADATVYNFVLADSKGNVPFKVSAVDANRTEKALTRAAATPNKGAYDMTVEYLATSWCGKAAGQYALTTETAYGIVASPYDVKITEKEINTISVLALANLSVDMNKELDLSKCFANTSVATVNGDAVNNLMPYIVDYYFEFADQAAAAAMGATISGKTFKATSSGTLGVKVYALLVSGEKIDGTTITVTVNHVAPVGVLGNVEWTITDAIGKNVVYLPIEAIQSQLVAATDTQYPTVVKEGSYTFANDKALNNNKVTVNGTDYGTTAMPVEEAWLGAIDETTLYTKTATGTYVAVASPATIRTPMYVKFTFNHTIAFPGSFKVKLGFRKFGVAVNAIEVPVNVIIKAPVVESPLRRLTSYFSGDNATVYGTHPATYAVGNEVTYNLFKLYADMLPAVSANVLFGETQHVSVGGHVCAAWLVDETSGDIKVKVYDNTTGANNSDNVYSTREMKVMYKIYGNVHIPYITDKFNLTVKSEIHEGTITVAPTAVFEGNGVDPIVVNFSNFTAKDVYGTPYNIAQMYKNTGTAAAPIWDVDPSAPQDDRISEVTLELADQNAMDYLEFVLDGGNQIYKSGTNAYPCFQVKKKATVTALVTDTPCKVTVKILDKWGVYTTFDVTITLKR